MGIRLEQLDPEFLPRKLDWYNLYIYFEDWFFEIKQLLPEFSGNFKIFWFTMRFEG